MPLVTCLRLSLAVLTLLGYASLAAAQGPADTLIVMGAETSGSWVTEYVFANDEASPLLLNVTLSPIVGSSCGLCSPPLTLLPNSTTTASFPELADPHYLVNYVVADRTPGVRARIYNRDSPCENMELPVFRNKTLIALNPSTLVFGVRPTAARTNLLLANLFDVGFVGSDVTLRIEALAADGGHLGFRDLTLLSDDQIYIVNIAQYLGIANPSSGQIRVSRLTGSGVFWGVLPSVDTDGTISITLGATP